MHDHNLVLWLLVRWSEPDAGDDDRGELGSPRNSQQNSPHKTCGGGINPLPCVAFTVYRALEVSETRFPVYCLIGGLEEKPWRPSRQAEFLSSRLTAARSPSAKGGALTR
jgi:hypothetical protein